MAPAGTGISGCSSFLSTRFRDIGESDLVHRGKGKAGVVERINGYKNKTSSLHHLVHAKLCLEKYTFCLSLWKDSGVD